MKRYTVGQMAKSMGVSAQTLRHYEEMGLVEAQRNEQNQYREFSMRDNKILMQTTLYRSMGFSLKEIRALFKEYQEEEVQRAFNRRIDEVDKQIEELQLLKVELREYVSKIHEALNYEGKCWIESENQEFYAVLKQGSGLGLESEDGGNLLEFQKKAPHIRQGFKISGERILNPNVPFDFQYGVFLKKDWAEKYCEHDEIEPYKVVLKGPIAHQIVETSRFSSTVFQPLLTMIDAKGYVVAGDFYGVALYMNYIKEDKNYFEFFVPLKLK